MECYDEYKDSNFEWFGKVPENWEIKRLKYLFKFVVGFTPPSGKHDYYGGKYTWITIADMKNKYLSDSVKTITEKAIEDLNPNIVPKNSLLYSFKLSVGKVAFTETDAYTNEAIFSVLPNENLNLDFYYYALPLQIIHNANENIYGAKILNQELIKNAFLVTPPKDEQIAIANYLNKKTAEIDNLISQKEQLLELYEEEKKGIINQAVTKEIDSYIKLKYYISKVGSGITPRGGANVYKLNGVQLLRSQNIHFDGLRLDNVVYISEDIHNSMGNSKVNAGDVLLNITGASIGRCYYAFEDLGEANVNQHVCIIRPNEKILTEFLYFILRSNLGQEQINQEQTGSGREGLNLEALKNFLIPSIGIDIQNSIVSSIKDEINSIDIKISKTKKIMALQKEYRTALISEVVTGKVKVTEEM